MNGKTSSPSLYLSQSYQDAWDDYNRSLRSSTFPVWDYIILTASNEHQAEAFRLQIESRREYLPKKTKIGIIPDEGGVRVGSGGATLSVLKWLDSQGGWKGRRILVIHSGGDSKRVPQYSALGKLFSPVPHMLPDGRSSTLFDEFLIAMSAVPGRIREGMLLLSGDVLLLFNPLLIDWSGSGAAVVSFKEDVETGKDHGVYLKGADGNVKSFLHKQSIDTLRSVGAVNEAGCVDIDTGMILFGVDVLDSLWTLISSDHRLDELKYRAFVNDRVRLSLYGDFQYPLAADSTMDQFYHEKPEGEYSDELHECRTAVWNALRPYRLKLLRLAPAKFIHFGTTAEILELMTGGVENYSELGWSAVTNSSASAPSYNSVNSPRASIGSGVYAEVSYVHSAATVGSGTVLSYIDIHDEVIPPHVVLHGLKQTDGKFVCRIFGVGDNPKENKLFGKELPPEFGMLWFAPIYPEKDTIREAVAAALDLYEKVEREDWEGIGELQALAPHTSKRDGLQSFLFFTVLSGEGELSYEGRTYSLEAGSCVFIDCRKAYSHTTSDKLWSLRWCHFYGPTLSFVYEKYVERGGKAVFQPVEAVPFLNTLDKLYELASGSDYIRDMRINEELNRLCTLLMEQSWHPEEAVTAPKKMSVVDVKEYLEQHYSERITLDDLASRFYINKYYLTRVFKEQYGMSITSYLTSLRITHN